jgi:hypothetical protein
VPSREEKEKREAPMAPETSITPEIISHYHDLLSAERSALVYSSYIAIVIHDLE